MLVLNDTNKLVQIDNFKVLKPLARGGFGTVYHVRDTREPYFEYALKLLHNILDTKRIGEELKVLKILNSSDLFLNTYLSKKVLNKFFILQDYIEDGDLKNKILKKVFSEKEVEDFLFNFISILEFLEQNKIIHGDIKAENILKKGSSFYLIDWGIAQRSSFIKTLHIYNDNDFVAPEVFRGIRTLSSDIYSLGCTLYFLLTNKHIYGFDSSTNFSQKMFAHLYKKPILHTNLSSKMFFIIKKMVDKNYKTRLTVKELKNILKNDDIQTTNISIVNKEDTFSSKFQRYLFMANDGVSYAQNIVGLLYEEGNGCNKDIHKAKYWYEKAANQGLAKAMFNLGLMYKEGKSDTIDYKEALKYFEMASEQHHSRAMYQIAQMYEYGLEVSKNMLKAKELYEKAAFHGFKPAYEKLVEL